MSDPVQPGQDGFVTVRELGLQGMVTLRGDLGDAVIQGAVEAATGQDMPAQRGILGGLGSGVAWMSPDELMVFCEAEKAHALADLLGRALEGRHHLAVDVTDARAVFALEGTAVREVMSKLCPVDMAPGRFEPGEIRRTRMAQIPAAFWMPETGVIHVICFRSVAGYAHDLLLNATRTPLDMPGWR